MFGDANRLLEQEVIKFENVKHSRTRKENRQASGQTAAIWRSISLIDSDSAIKPFYQLLFKWSKVNSISTDVVQSGSRILDS